MSGRSRPSLTPTAIPGLGTPGYDASADYVAGKLEDAGYNVTRQEFEYELFIENSDPVARRTRDLPPYTPGDTARTTSPQ